MGEYFIVANLDKRQHLDPNTLGMSSKLDGVIGGPLADILIWLLADAAPPLFGRPGWRGSWAGDRIVVAGDEGSAAGAYAEAISRSRDITIEAFEASANSSFILMKYGEAGVLDDDGKFILDWASRTPATNDRPPDDRRGG